MNSHPVNSVWSGQSSDNSVCLEERMRRSFQRFSFLPLIVTETSFSQAKSLLSRSQLEFHSLELSERLLRHETTGDDKNTIYRTLLPHIQLQHASLSILSGELLSEQIEKTISFHNPLNQKEEVRYRIFWRCERHNNPHMGINSFRANVWSSLGCDETNQEVELLSADENDGIFSSQLIDKNLTYLDRLSVNCLEVSKNNECRYRLSKRDMSWFLSFLLTHPSDPAFDVVSDYLMR